MLAAALLYAVLAVAMVGPGLVPGHALSGSDYVYTAAPWQTVRPAGIRPVGGSNPELADSAAVFQPFTRRVRSTLPSIALWNPDIGAGRPLLADMQSAVFSPFSAPSYVLPFWWSLGVVAALRLFMAALGTFALARALSIGMAGSLLSGAAFGLSLWMVAWVSWPLASVWAMLPWVLVAVDRVIRRPDAAGVAMLGAASGVTILAGHPESALHAGFAAAAFGLLRLSRMPDQRWRRTGLTLLGAGSGALLAAVVLIPFLELVAHSNDVANRAQITRDTLPRRDLLGLFFPEYWGRATQITTIPFLNGRAMYDGALALLLAGVGVLRPTRERLAVAVAVVVCLLVVFDVWPFTTVAAHTPGLGQTYVSRLAVLFCLGVALLAGWGLEDVLAGRRAAPADRRARWLIPALAGVAALPLLYVVAHDPLDGAIGRAAGVALGIKTDLGVDNIDALLPTASAIAWLLLAGAALVLIALTWRGRIRPPVAAGLAIALVAIDLMRFGVGINPAIPTSDAHPPVTAAVSLLQRRTPARYVGVVPGFGIPPLFADVGMDFGLQDARSYDYPVFDRYDTLWRTGVVDNPFLPPTTLAPTTPIALRTLSLLGVRSFVQQPTDRPLHVGGLRLIYDRPDARVYDNPAALPRAWVVDRQTPIAGDTAQLHAIEAPGFAAASTVVVGAALPGIATGAGRAGARARPARIAKYGAEHVTVVARAARRSVVVLSDVAYPGWHAEVDGHAAAIHRVDYLLRGVVVGPGTHRVQFTYRPVSYRLGWLISILTAAALIAAVLIARRRRARPIAA